MFHCMLGLEKNDPFCCNPDCACFVRAGDSGVVGWGNWARLPDGRTVGRRLCYGVFLCDSCAVEWHAVTPNTPTSDFATRG